MHDATLPFAFDLPDTTPLRLTGFFQDQRLSAEIPERSGIVLTRDGTTLRSLTPHQPPQKRHIPANPLPPEIAPMPQQPLPRLDE